MKAKFKSSIQVAPLIREAFCAGVVLLISINVQAQNLFVADWTGRIYEFTPDGQQITFASGLSCPQGLTFDSAGDLFVAQWGINGPSTNGSIIRITPAESEALWPPTCVTLTD